MHAHYCSALKKHARNLLYVLTRFDTCTLMGYCHRRHRIVVKNERLTENFDITLHVPREFRKYLSRDVQEMEETETSDRVIKCCHFKKDAHPFWFVFKS